MNRYFTYFIFCLFQTGVSGQYSMEFFDKSNSPITSDEIFTVKFIDDAMWVCTWNNGLCHVKNNEWKILKSDSIHTTNDNIIDIIKDRFGNIWVVGYAFFYGSSVVRYNGSVWEVLTPFNDSTTQISGVTEDINGNLWFKTYGSGIYFYDFHSWTHITPSNSGLSDWTIRCIQIDENNQKWIGHYSHGFDLLKDTTWVNHFGTGEISIETIAFAKNGDVWLGTLEYGVKLFGDPLNYFDTLNSPLPSNYINHIAIDSKDQVWIATDKGLVIKKADGWITFDNTPIEGLQIRDITFENDSSIWLSSWGKGLIHLIPQNNTSLKLTPEEKDISIYPNPFINNIKIQFQRRSFTNKMEVLTIHGQTVFSQKITSDQYVDLAFLRPGLYVVKLVTEDGLYIKELLKVEGL